MKFEAAVLVTAITGAAAQTTSSFPTMTASNSSATPFIVTMTIDDCSSSLPPTMITVTNGVTVTYCPACEMSKSSAAAASATPGHTTVYTTYYQSLCTTASSWYTTPVVYTVTESCTGSTPTYASAPNYVPPGFTTSVVECAMCEGGSPSSPATMTITQPCDCTHTGFYASVVPTTPTSGAAPGPVSQISDGQVQAPTAAPVSQISDGQVQAPTATGAPVSQISDGQVQAPTGAPVSQISDGQIQASGPATTTVRCPGGTACSSPAASTSLQAYTGAASKAVMGSWTGVLCSIAVVFVGGLAVLL